MRSEGAAPRGCRRAGIGSTVTPRTQWLAVLLLLVALGLATVFLPNVDLRPPRLVVLIVVDQLRTDYIDRFREHYDGGFRWLLANGAYFPDAMYRHAMTVTAVGHATVATGLHPSSHGIVGNSWQERGKGEVYCVDDDQFAAVGGPGRSASPRALLADTLGDALKARDAASRVYSFSRKDRAAILLAGRAADGAFWYEDACGCLVTSSYYLDSVPEWLSEFDGGSPSARYAGREWTRLLEDDGLYERKAREDAFPPEDSGRGAAFPHGRAMVGFESSLAATPFSDEITLGAARAALESGEVGGDDIPDLLALGLSATDSVGHRYGPFSQEAMDNHLRLDRKLGELIDAIDSSVGLANVVFALTADHGAIPFVEYLRAGGESAERFDTAALWRNARIAIERCGQGPVDETVAEASGTRLFWAESALEARNVRRADASACVADWLRGQHGIETVLTAEEIVSDEGQGVEVLFRNSYFEGRSPHVQLHLRKYFYPGQTGTGHGSAHNYDRRVPIILAGNAVIPGRYGGEAGPSDVAPTLGAILGLEIPPEYDARLLREALRHEFD